jgi:copper chaperone CopZ
METQAVMNKEAGEGAAPAPSPQAGDEMKHRTERMSLPISGMSCAACAARIEKNLNRAPGVAASSVNFATRQATIEYSPAETSPEALAGVVRDSGYEVPERPAPPGETNAVASEEDWEQREREAEYQD